MLDFNQVRKIVSKISKPIINRLELLYKTLQGRSINFNSMKERIALIRAELSDLCNEESLKMIYDVNI